MPISFEEVSSALNAMNTNATTGAFGLDISTLKWLMTLERTSSMLINFLQGILDNKFDENLLLTIMSAIPKPKKPPTTPKNLRPISVDLWPL